MSHVRPALSIALALIAAACGERRSASRATTSSAATPAGAATATGPKPKPPVLEYAAAKHPGILVSWREPAPCDTIEGERHDVTDPYPSDATPPGPPHFSVPGATRGHDGPRPAPAGYLDTVPAENFVYTYHVRCRVQGVASDWSNERAANPTK